MRSAFFSDGSGVVECGSGGRAGSWQGRDYASEIRRW